MFSYLMITDFLNFGFDTCNPLSLVVSYLTLVCALVAKAGLVWVSGLCLHTSWMLLPTAPALLG